MTSFKNTQKFIFESQEIYYLNFDQSITMTQLQIGEELKNSKTLQRFRSTTIIYTFREKKFSASL